MKRSGFKPRTRPMGDVILANGFKARASGLKSRQRAVTAAEKQFWTQLAEIVGCVACRIDGRINTYVSIHHIDGRTKPGCHRNVLPLCAPHHQQDDTDPLRRVSVHGSRKTFEALYGSQPELLAGALNILGVGQ